MTARREIPFGRPGLTDDDRRAVMKVMDGSILTHGPECKTFEQEFAAFLGPDAHCVTVSSGMAALHLACLHFGLHQGDEVIVPAQTHTATVHAVEWVGARPVFVDCSPATGNVTPKAVTAAITPRTRAVMVVHFIGIPCHMPGIVEIAREHRLRVIEDCALALGSRYEERHVGLFGDAGCFSFYPVKHITTGEGGMFVTRHADVAEAVTRLRAFGVDRSHSERTIPGMYDVTSLGLNYRMSELQAALGRSQLRHLLSFLAKRRSNYTALKAALQDIPNVRVLDSTEPQAVSSHYCLSAVFSGRLAAQRNDVIGRLNAAGIGTSIYYPHPVPRLSYYRKKYNQDPSGYPHATEISDHSVALPVGPHLTEDDMQYMTETVKRIISEVNI